MSQYDVKDSNFTFSYFAFKNTTDPILTVEKSFSGKITRLDSGVLQLDGTVTFIKFVPSKNASLTDNAAELCN